ncbi:MAG: glycosyl transferase family 2, partial [Xanthobacteraceae bacterium]
ICVPFVVFAGIAVPDKILTIPILAAFMVSVAHFAALYRLRVKIPPGQALGAVFAAMSVQWTVARAVGFGLFKDTLPFIRTAKGGNSRKGQDFPAFWEAVIAGLLLASAIFVYATNWERVREINMFALVLAVQSLPFLSAMMIAALESSRANEFAAWRALEARITGLLPQRGPIIEAPATAEKRVEPVQ